MDKTSSNSFTFIPQRDIPFQRFSRRQTTRKPVKFHKKWTSPVAEDSSSSLETTNHHQGIQKSKPLHPRSTAKRQKKNSSDHSDPKASSNTSKRNASKELASSGIDDESAIESTGSGVHRRSDGPGTDRSSPSPPLSIRVTRSMAKTGESRMENTVGHKETDYREKDSRSEKLSGKSGSRQMNFHESLAKMLESGHKSNINNLETTKTDLRSTNSLRKSNNLTNQKLSKSSTGQHSIVSKSNTRQGSIASVQNKRTLHGTVPSKSTNVNQSNEEVNTEEGSEMEELNITHRVPLAQSTAIGVEIEQECDEDDEIEEEDEGAEQTFGNQGDAVSQFDNPTSNMDTSEKENRFFKSRSLKKKILLSHQKKMNASSKSKKRKISIATPVRIENVVCNTSTDTVEQNVSTVADTVEQNPTLSSDFTVASEAEASNPPSRQPTAPKRRVEQPRDNSADTRPPPIELRVWQGDFEMERKKADITDLDVVLHHFEETTWQFRENLQSPAVRKAVSLFAKNTQADLRNLIDSSQRVRHLKTSVNRSQSLIRQRTTDLLEVQKRHRSLHVELSTLRTEHATTTVKSQKTQDILHFTDLFKKSQKEKENTSKKSKGPTQRIIGPRVEDHEDLPEECKSQLMKIQSNTMNFLQSKMKK